MSVASEDLQARPAMSRRLLARSLERALPLAVLGGIAAWLASERSRIPTPSPIDDWFGVTYSPAAAHALFHGDYSEALDFGGRFRPAYTGVWNYVQWHLLGEPSVVTAAALGTLRTALFLTGIWLLTAWLVGRDAPVTRALLWLAPAAVILTPGIADDLARFGPADPMMVGGLIVGLALIAKGVRTSFKRTARTSWQRASAVALIAIGYAVYVLGVYSKEASVCLLVFVPFFVKWLGPARAAFVAQSRTWRVAQVALLILVIAPLLHLSAHLVEALVAGDRPYPTAERSLPAKVLSATVSPLLGQPSELGTWLWFFAAPSAVAIAIVAAVRRQRDAWLLGGVLLTGYLMTAVALARGEVGSWYYIPWLVAVAAVVFHGLARARLRSQLAVVLLVVGLAATSTPQALADWVQAERSASRAIGVARGVVSAGCPLYLAHFDIERRVAVPLLFPFADGRPIPQCRGNSPSPEAYAISWDSRPLPRGFAKRCQGRWQRPSFDDGFSVFRCESFRPGPILDQNAASAYPLVKVVRVRVTDRPPLPRALFQP
jgi:hypothetical protein